MEVAMIHRCLPILCAALITLIWISETVAQEHHAAGEQMDHLMVIPGNLAWKDGPGSLPKGARWAPVEGDMTKAGPFTVRLKLPANYDIPPHWHPAIEHVTVLSGSFYMGTGEKFDRSRATKLPIGGFAMMAVGTRHFAFTTEEAVLQLHGMGPWGITYVNPADDPRTR